MKEIPHLAEALAQILREAREHARLSQQELARRMECARSFISFMETRDHLPSLNAFLALSRALDIPGNELLTRLESRLAALADCYAGEASQATAPRRKAAPRSRKRDIG